MSIDLTAKQGPRKGERFPIVEELLIGRSSKGVNLPDTSVSLQHAKVVSRRDGYALLDLGSATGTLLNGDPIPANRPMDLDVGDQILIGDTLFLVGSARARALRAVVVAMAPAWFLVVAGTALVFLATGEPDLTLGLKSPVNTHEGAVTELTFPSSFLREFGILPSDLGLRQVTDIDGNGIDELWLRSEATEHIVTFEADGAWTLLGSLPLNCRVSSDGEKDILCGPTTYRRVGATYEPVFQSEPLVWLTGAVEPVAYEGPPENAPPLPPGVAVLNGGGMVPFRVEPGAMDRVSGFLAERGVTSGVHYILCEDVVEGLPAQVMTESGEAVQLGFGCSKDLFLEGPKAANYAGARLAAVALSASGAQRLADHISYTLSGSEEPLFLEPAQARLADTFRQAGMPSKGGLRLTTTSSPHVFSPIAKGALPPRSALRADFARPSDVVSARIIEPGDALLKVDGCGKLQIHTAHFRCALLRGCLPGYSFVRVRDIGCAESPVGIVDSGFESGTWAGASDDVEVRVHVDSQGGMFIRDVLRARVGARPIAKR